MASCGEPAIPATDTAPAQASEYVECAHPGAPLTRNCTVELQRNKDGVVLTIRHPDGAFRRLLVATDGRGVVAADGAQQASIRVIDGGGIDVALAGDRYRLPATIRRIAQ